MNYYTIRYINKDNLNIYSYQNSSEATQNEAGYNRLIDFKPFLGLMTNAGVDKRRIGNLT